MRDSHLLVHSPNDCNSWGWAKTNQETGAFSRLPTQGVGDQTFGPSYTAFLDHKQEVGWKVKQLGHELMLIWDAGAAGRLFNVLCHSAGL